MLTSRNGGRRLDNPLAADDYPVIVIPHIRRVYGESTGRERYHVALRAAVSNGGVETDMVAKTVVYLGLLQAEELRELACDALVRARFAKLDFEAETGNVVTYPEFVSLFAVTISTINIRRRLK